MSPPAHVYGVLEEAAPALPVDATTMPVAATSAVIRSTKRRIQLPLLVSPPVAGHAVWCPHRSAVKWRSRATRWKKPAPIEQPVDPARNYWLISQSYKEG